MRAFQDADDSGGHQSKRARWCSPMPATGRARRLLAGVDGSCRAPSRRDPYASPATVFLAYRRDANLTHPLDGVGFVVPRVEHTGILAASWLSSKRPHRAPVDRVLLRTFVGGARDPQALELFGRGAGRALDQGHRTAARPARRAAARADLSLERASAQHEVGHLARMAAIDRALTRHPGLFVTGSGFRGVGIPDCIADGRRTGAAVTEWLRVRKDEVERRSLNEKRDTRLSWEQMFDPVPIGRVRSGLPLSR